MKRFFLFAFAMSFLLSPQLARCQATGIELLEECKDVEKYPHATQQQAIKASHCLGYINGLTDTIGWWNADNRHRHVKVSPLGCLSHTASMQEFAMVVVKYLEDHPNKLHEEYGLLVTLALHDAYPCRP